MTVHCEAGCGCRVVRAPYPVEVRIIEREKDARPLAHVAWCGECGAVHEIMQIDPSKRS